MTLKVKNMKRMHHKVATRAVGALFGASAARAELAGYACCMPLILDGSNGSNLDHLTGSHLGTWGGNLSVRQGSACFRRVVTGRSGS